MSTMVSLAMGVTLRLTHYAMPRSVMPALVAGIHVFGAASETWMAGTSPAMTLYIWLRWVRFGKNRRLGLRVLGFVLAKRRACFGFVLTKRRARFGFVLADLRRLLTSQAQPGGGESAHGEFAPRAHAPLVAVNGCKAPN